MENDLNNLYEDEPSTDGLSEEEIPQFDVESEDID